MTALLVVPPPRYLRAGAVWVTIGNWREGAKRRYGAVQTICSDGVLDEEALLLATTLHSRDALEQSVLRRSVPLQQPVKDLRTLGRALSQNRHFRNMPLDDYGPWVWQHHNLFLNGGMSIARSAKVPLVLFVDAPIIWESSRWGTRRRWGRALERLGESPQFRKADVVACVSEEVAHACVELGASSDRVIITPCTADANKHEHVSDRRGDLAISDEFVIGWVGSFRGFHGVESIVRVLAQLPSATPRPVLLLVGDGPERSSVLDEAESAGIRCIAPGAVPHDQIPSYLKTMDLAVVTSRRNDPFHYSPLKVKEFLAAGLPTVAPQVGELARFLRHGHDSYLYEAGNLEEMRLGILTLIDDPNLRTSIGLNAITTCRRHFDIDKQILELECFLGIS